MVGTPSAVDVNWQGRRFDNGYKVWPVSGSLCKSELYAWIRLQLPTDETLPEPPGYCHFPEYDAEYFRQLTAEQLVTRKTRSGRLVMGWEVIPGRENHFLDARVYARCAAAVAQIDTYQEEDWQALELAAGYATEDMPPPSTPPPAPGNSSPQSDDRWIPRRSGWLRPRR
jgi:phage terminase large subunit GpA-like protein